MAKIADRAFPSPGERRSSQRRRLWFVNRAEAPGQSTHREPAFENSLRRGSGSGQAHQAMDVLQTQRECHQGLEERINQESLNTKNDLSTTRINVCHPIAHRTRSILPPFAVSSQGFSEAHCLLMRNGWCAFFSSPSRRPSSGTPHD